MSTSMSATDPRAHLAQRLWVYQAERFPVFKHGMVIAAFALAGAALPTLLSGSPAPLDPSVASVAIAVSFLFFLQLRIADEHKDFRDDCRFRPERPAPRGLVRLVELRWVAIAGGLVQALLAWALDPALLAPLALTWIWMALMTAEFFAPKALKARPILYMASHMAVMPFIALFTIACGWAGGVAPSFSSPVAALLALAFINGAAIEIARKSWAPQDERRGVDTYSKLWGPRGAAAAAMLAIIIGVACALFVLLAAGASILFSIVAVAFASLGLGTALAYAAEPTPRRAKLIELGASLWVLASYVLIAIAPFATGVTP